MRTVERMSEFRPDRLATLYCFRPARRLLRRHGRGIPILMYHSISNAPELDNRPYYRTCTRPEVFRRQIEFLHRNGYTALTLSAAARALALAEEPSGRLVALTFDDGYADFFSEAYPVLNEFGFAATVFLPTAYIGAEQRQFNGIGCLTWSQIRELHQSGVEFGSHTVSHPQLADLPMSSAEQELRASKMTIEENIGAAVASFGYPYAFPEHRHAFVAALRTSLEDCGYRFGVCTMIGTANRNSDPLFLERLPVNSLDDENLLAAKLEGAYDWLRFPQRLSKVLRSGRQ
jgi:peptidoglycan/xylan/chitin deacetylase (PgdA/CDA1 family)